MQIRNLLSTSLTILLLIGCAQPLISPDTPSPVNGSSTTLEALTQVDKQRSVTVELTPINLGAPGGTISFDVTMDTHLVELDIDLTGLATLTTDTGLTVAASAWDGGRGGHHLSGTLSFPALVDGKPLLEDASTLTVTIRDVAAPERKFQWTLKP
jgi:hypothetical protein